MGGFIGAPGVRAGRPACTVTVRGRHAGATGTVGGYIASWLMSVGLGGIASDQHESLTQFMISPARKIPKSPVGSNAGEMRRIPFEY